jgi:transportin-3
LEAYRNGPKVIKTQLCLALADLAIQSDEWQNVFEDMQQRYASQTQMASLLIEFFTVLPEEVDGNNRIPILVSLIYG